jgi:hypothetical protein
MQGRSGKGGKRLKDEKMPVDVAAKRSLKKI